MKRRDTPFRLRFFVPHFDLSVSPEIPFFGAGLRMTDNVIMAGIANGGSGTEDRNHHPRVILRTFDV